MSKSTGIVLDCKNLGDIFDDSRYKHSIVNHNAIPVRGMHGRGMYFNGNNAYLDCGNDASLNITDAITIEAWVKPTSACLTGYHTIVAKTHGASPVPIYFTLHNGVLRNYNTITGSATLSADIWYHVVWLATTVSGGGGKERLYIDGNIDKEEDSQWVSTATVISLGIGALTVPSEVFNGTIDNVTIYNYALSADEIKLHYRQQSPYYQQEAPTIIL